MPGISDAVNTLRSCVAPVLTTKDGSTPGAVMGTRSRRRLANAVWPAETKNAPPTVWKTGEALLVFALREGKSRWDGPLTERYGGD